MSFNDACANNPKSLLKISFTKTVLQTNFYQHSCSYNIEKIFLNNIPTNNRTVSMETMNLYLPIKTSTIFKHIHNLKCQLLFVHLYCLNYTLPLRPVIMLITSCFYYVFLIIELMFF